MAATVPHCSKCCPVKPPKPAAPEPVPASVWMMFVLVGVALAAGCALILWVADALFT